MELQLTMRNEELRNLVTQLKYQRVLRHDMVVPATSIGMHADKTMFITDAPAPPNPEVEGHALASELLALGIPVQNDLDSYSQRFTLLSIADGQFASRLSIPKKYWNLMDETNRELLSKNVNGRLNGPGGIAHTRDGNFLVRTFRPSGKDQYGIIRSFLSDRYRVMDNMDLLFTTLKTLQKLKAPIDAENIICNLTERKMYLQIQCPSIYITANELLDGYRNPDTGRSGGRIHAGLRISNSETGMGAFEVMPRPFAYCCMNCFSLRSDALRKVHLGTQLEEGVVDWSEETKQKNLELIELQVADAVNTFLSEDYLLALSLKFQKQAARHLDHPENALRNYSAHLGISEEEQADVLKYFYKSGQDDRAIGLVNAVTFHAQQLGDADRQYEIEDAALEALAYVNRFDVPLREMATG